MSEMRAWMHPLSIGASLLLAVAVGGCGGDEDEPVAPDLAVSIDDGTAGAKTTTPPVTATCEEITFDNADWRRRTTAVGTFGLFVKYLTSQSTELPNGNHLVKAGAGVEGNEPVTLSVPEAFRGSVGLIYGDASRGRRQQPSTAPTQVTFEPCPGEKGSGYVGGLIFRGAPRAIELEVRSRGSSGLLALRP